MGPARDRALRAPDGAASWVRSGREEPDLEPINIRNLSIKCGHCETYQTLSGYRPEGESNVYVYECENDVCDPAMTRTLVEVPRDLDQFAERDSGWRGGGKHGDWGNKE